MLYILVYKKICKIVCVLHMRLAMRLRAIGSFACDAFACDAISLLCDALACDSFAISRGVPRKNWDYIKANYFKQHKTNFIPPNKFCLYLP